VGLDADALRVALELRVAVRPCPAAAELRSGMVLRMSTPGAARSTLSAPVLEK
jgi:hypothetical protein